MSGFTSDNKTNLDIAIEFAKLSIQKDDYHCAHETDAKNLVAYLAIVKKGLDDISSGIPVDTDPLPNKPKKDMPPSN